MEGAVPLTNAEAEYHVNTIEGGMQFCLAMHAREHMGTPEYGKILGLSSADHIKQFHPDAAPKAKATPTPSRGGLKSTPVASDPDKPWTIPSREETDRILKDSGGVPGYN